MENAKRKRGRPPKRKAMEFEGMTYEGAINNALDKEVAAELDDTLADKDEIQLTDDERKYLKRKREKKSYTFNVRFTESEMQDIVDSFLRVSRRLISFSRSDFVKKPLTFRCGEDRSSQKYVSKPFEVNIIGLRPNLRSKQSA